MEKYNSMSVIPDSLWSEPDQIIACDACLDAVGGLCYMDTIYYYKTQIPERWKNNHICVYELLAVYTALQLWSKVCQNKRLLIQSDNSSTVVLLNSGKCKDKQMLSIARNIWLVCAESNIQVKSIHLSSQQNRDADMLSRWYIDDACQHRFKPEFKSKSICECHVSDSLFQLDETI